MESVPLDPEIADYMARVPDDEWMRLAGQSPADARAHYRAVTLERRGEDYAPQALGSVTDTTFPGPAGPLAARLYEPEEAIAATVVYFHGGGWVIGDLDTHDPQCRALAADTRATVAAIDYRLAPETPYPGPLEDCLAALRWVAAERPGDLLAVAGDSADGADGADGLPRLAAQLLNYPALDPLMGEPSIAENADDPFLGRANMRWFYDR
jgi:acetyl esterase